MIKRVQATISNDLFAHILALKEYGNYKSLSALVEESLWTRAIPKLNACS